MRKEFAIVRLDLEASYEKKLQDMNGRYEDLKNAKDDLQFQLEEQLRMQQLKQNREIDQLKQAHQLNLKVSKYRY